MATEGPGTDDGCNYIAAADLSAKQFFAVAISGARAVNVAGSAVNIVGILQNKPKSGEAVNVRFLGVSKAIAGATIAAGDKLMTDAAGKLITQTSTNPVVATALEAAVVNQIFSVRVMPTPG